MFASRKLLRGVFLPIMIIGFPKQAHSESMTVEGNAYPIQPDAFTLIREMEDDASNYEILGGFIEPPTRILKRRYDNDEEAPGYAKVEILVFAESDDGIHSVLNVAFSESTDNSSHASNGPNDDWLASLLSNVDVLRCQLIGRTSPDYVLFIRGGKPPFSGFATWSSNHDDELICIFIEFEHLNGLPVELFATLLMEYPSAIPQSLPGGDEWKREELLKWRNCFASVPGKRALLIARSSPLLSRERELLGREISSLSRNWKRSKNRELTDEERQELCKTIAQRIDAGLQ